MNTTLRKMVFMVAMALVLLAGLFGWTIKMEATHPFAVHQSSVHAGHTLSSILKPYCPPPPYDCR